MSASSASDKSSQKSSSQIGILIELFVIICIMFQSNDIYLNLKAECSKTSDEEPPSENLDEQESKETKKPNIKIYEVLEYPQDVLETVHVKEAIEFLVKNYFEGLKDLDIMKLLQIFLNYQQSRPDFSRTDPLYFPINEVREKALKAPFKYTLDFLLYERLEWFEFFEAAAQTVIREISELEKSPPRVPPIHKVVLPKIGDPPKITICDIAKAKRQSRLIWRHRSTYTFSQLSHGIKQYKEMERTYISELEAVSDSQLKTNLPEEPTKILPKYLSVQEICETLNQKIPNLDFARTINKIFTNIEQMDVRHYKRIPLEKIFKNFILPEMPEYQIITVDVIMRLFAMTDLARIINFLFKTETELLQIQEDIRRQEELKKLKSPVKKKKSKKK